MKALNHGVRPVVFVPCVVSAQSMSLSECTPLRSAARWDCVTRPYSSRVRCTLSIIPEFSANDMISSNREEAFEAEGAEKVAHNGTAVNRQ